MQEIFLVLIKIFLILITSSNLSYFTKRNFFQVNFLLISFISIIILFVSLFNYFIFINFIVNIFLYFNVLVFIFYFRGIKNYKYELIFIILFLLVIFFSTNNYINWDEYTQWGFKSKQIYFFKENLFSEYNQGTNNKFWIISLFHNFINFETNYYSEKNFIISQSFILISGLFYIFSFFKKLNTKNAFLFLIFFYFISYIFNYGIYTLYLDLLVVIYFTSLVLIILEKRISKFELFEILLLVSCLLFLKTISFVFVFFIVIFYAIITFSRKKKYKFPILVIFFIFIIFFIYQSLIFYNGKGYYLSIQYFLERNFYNGENINYYFFNNLIEKNIYQGKFFNLFVKSFEYFGYDFLPVKVLNLNFNLVFWVFFIFIFSFYIFLQNKEKKYIFYFILNFIFLIIYLIILYFYSVAVPTSLSSFERYCGFYLLYWLIFLYFQLDGISIKKKSFLLQYLYIIFFIISSSGVSYENLISKYLNLGFTHQKIIIKKKSNLIKIHNLIENKKSKIYFINQGQDEFYFHVARYIAWPILSNHKCSSLVSDLSQKQLYDCFIDIDTFRDKLFSYDYLVFLNQNTDTIENYNLENHLIMIASHGDITLYQIIK